MVHNHCQYSTTINLVQNLRQHKKTESTPKTGPVQNLGTKSWRVKTENWDSNWAGTEAWAQSRTKASDKGNLTRVQNQDWALNQDLNPKQGQ